MSRRRQVAAGGVAAVAAPGVSPGRGAISTALAIVARSKVCHPGMVQLGRVQSGDAGNTSR